MPSEHTMSQKAPPPDIVISRLPIYLRVLESIAKENRDVTSSYELGERLGMSSAQIRKDLAHFGDFGKQGTGYQISFLSQQLRHILRLNQEWPVVLIGAGHMGQALANYRGFAEHRFKVVGIFDSDPAKQGLFLAGLTVQAISHLQTFIRGAGVKIAMLAVPAEAAQAITDLLTTAGIQAILNYAPLNLNVPPGVQVQYIDPIGKLQHMTYYLQTDS
jgi:redox-sensing transcriptional repressor